MKLHWAKPALRTWTIGVHGGRRTDVLAQGRLGPYMHTTHNRLGRQRLKNRITWEQVRETEHRDTGEEGARERKRGQETWRVLNIASTVSLHTQKPNFPHKVTKTAQIVTLFSHSMNHQ